MASARASLRVHIAPVGFEIKRVTEPLIQLRADRVYLLTGRADDAARKYWEGVHTLLAREYKTIEVRDRFENVWDFYRVLGHYGELVRKETADGNQVFVNVSTGTKITAMVGLLSSMFWGTTPYYARTGYGVGTELIPGIDPVPLLRFDVLPPDLRQILLTLKQKARPTSKEELIGALREVQLLPPVGGLSVPAIYRRLDGYLLPLSSRGFIEITGQRRAARVQLTDEGRAALLLLEPMALPLDRSSKR